MRCLNELRIAHGLERLLVCRVRNGIVGQWLVIVGDGQNSLRTAITSPADALIPALHTAASGGTEDSRRGRGAVQSGSYRRPCGGPPPPRSVHVPNSAPPSGYGGCRRARDEHTGLAS